MSDNEYCVLWNDIRIKFFKNIELKEMKENIINIFETQSSHFIYLYLEFILDYINQNSLSIEQKFKIANIILKYGTIKSNNASTTTNSITTSSGQISQTTLSYPNFTNSKTLLEIPFNKLKKLSLLTTIVSFDFNYNKNSLIYLNLYLITLFCYEDTVETKEDFLSLLSEYADNISYILIFIFNGLINELTTSEKRISFINNYGVPILMAYFNSYNKYYIYFSSIILVELFSDNKCQAVLLKKFYNDKFFKLCCKILNYNNVNISENICIALQKMASYRLI
ncbi:hypothetical protein H8356DRAFT_1071682 [Neocallimastix lanati (nom. inval.)]|nr:hypothetical protein H8356DRAFT_1071682 [Neocallimastix sp. JGI-2020a]